MSSSRGNPSEPSKGSSGRGRSDHHNSYTLNPSYSSSQAHSSGPAQPRHSTPNRGQEPYHTYGTAENSVEPPFDGTSKVHHGPNYVSYANTPAAWGEAHRQDNPNSSAYSSHQSNPGNNPSATTHQGGGSNYVSGNTHGNAPINNPQDSSFGPTFHDPIVGCLVFGCKLQFRASKMDEHLRVAHEIFQWDRRIRIPEACMLSIWIVLGYCRYRSVCAEEGDLMYK